MEAKQCNTAREAHLVEKVSELTTELEMETHENKCLSDQIERVKTELQKEETRSLMMTNNRSDGETKRVGDSESKSESV